MVDFDSGYISVYVKVVDGIRYLTISITDEDKDIKTTAVLDMAAVQALAEMLLDATLDKSQLN